MPKHPFRLGVTVILATSCAKTLLEMNAKISPVPLAARPIAVLSFAQSKVALAVPVKIVALKVALAQTVWSIGSITEGVGFIVKTTAVRVADTQFVVVFRACA